MARPLRLEYPGALYHVTSRGNARNDIFTGDTDRELFLSTLTSAQKRFNWLCHAYCLMDNHYHLMIETPEGNLSRGMRHLNGVYTQRFNRLHARVGHLFQGRYKALIIEKESYLLELCRYIVLNPVRAGMVKRAGLWNWSSYKSTVGMAAPQECLSTEWILSQFGDDKKMASRNYRDFIEERDIESDGFQQEVKGQIFLGSNQFIEMMDKRFSGLKAIKEIPRTQRYAARPSLEKLFAEQKPLEKDEVDGCIYEAYALYGYRLKEIADYLEIHYSTVSRAIKKIESKALLSKI